MSDCDPQLPLVEDNQQPADERRESKSKLEDFEIGKSTRVLLMAQEPGLRQKTDGLVYPKPGRSAHLGELNGALG